LAAEWLIGTFLTRFALPGFTPLPWKEILILFAYAMVTCPVLNDSLKRVLLKFNGGRLGSPRGWPPGSGNQNPLGLP
jgi:hypothetical protein